MGHSPSPDIEKLLQDLRTEQALDTTRRKAAEALGELSVSSLRVVNALVTAMQSDPVSVVRRQAAASLRAPAHQDVLRRYPALMEKVLEIQLAQSAGPGDLGAEISEAEIAVVCPDCGRTNRGVKLYYCQHCGHSLEHALRVAPAEPQPTSKAHEAMLREIRSWGRWSLALGVVHLLISGLSVSWGMLLLIVGAASFYFSEASMFVIYSVTLAWVAISNVLTGQSGWAAFAILQFVFAFQVYRQFTRFRQAEAELDMPPDSRRAARLFPGAGCLLGAVSLGGWVLTFVSLIVFFDLDGADLPALFVWMEGLSVNLGALAVAVGLASLLSGYRHRPLAVLGMAAGALVLLVRTALVLL